MRRAHLLTILIVLILTAAAAHAADFRLIATRLGPNQYTYSLTNNSTTVDVVEFTLHWNPNDWMDDLNQGLANFDSNDGVVPPIPSLWYQIPAVYPWLGTGGEYGAIKRGGDTKGGYKVKYGTTSNPTPVKPQWFVVWYQVGGNRVASEMIPITEEIVPEPGTAVTIVLGTLALGGVLRRRVR